MRGLENQETFNQAIAIRAAIKKLEALYDIVKDKINDALQDEPGNEYTYKGVTITQKQRPRVSYKGIKEVEEAAKVHKDLKLKHKKAATTGTITYYEVKYNSTPEEIAWNNEANKLVSDINSLESAILGMD